HGAAKDAKRNCSAMQMGGKRQTIWAGADNGYFSGGGHRSVQSSGFRDAAICLIIISIGEGSGVCLSTGPGDPPDVPSLAVRQVATLKPTILLASTNSWLSPVRIAGTFADLGCRVQAVCTP